MSARWLGGRISQTPPAPAGANINDSAPGVWNLNQVSKYQANNAWPGTATRDAYFQNNTILISGNGTNGANNNTFLDSSSNNFTITRNGNTTQGSFSPYQNHWSNYFNISTSSSIYTSGSQIIPATGDFTAECWVNLNSYDNPATVFSQGTSGTSGYIGLFVGGYGDNIALVLTIGTTSHYPNGPVFVNNWNHIAIQRTGSTVTGYLNGYAYISATNSATISNSPLYVGSTNSPSQYLNGWVSNMRVSNVIRYSGAFVPDPAPFVSDANTVLLTCQANRFIDSGPNNYTINLVNSPQISRFSGTQLPQQYNTPNYGGSAYFDGTGDYLTSPSNAAYTLGSSGDFTVDGWFYMTSDGGGIYPIITNYNNWDTGYANRFYVGFASNVFRWYDSSGSTAISTSSYKLNTWNYFNFTRSGSTITGYLNGTSIGTQSTNQDYTTDDVLRMGGGMGNGGNFTGYVANLRIIKGATVSGASIPTTPSTAVSGTTFLANFNNAAITDSTTLNNWETVGNTQVSTTQSKFGGSSIYFDGSSSGLYAPPNPDFAFGYNNFTVEFWVYYASTSASYVFIDMRGASGSGTAPTIYMTGGTFYVAFGTGNVISTTPPSANAWHHIAISRNSSSTKLFIDGVQAGSTYTASTNMATAYYTTVGYYAGGGYTLNGYMSNVRVTKGIARYLQNFAVPVAPFPTY